MLSISICLRLALIGSALVIPASGSLAQVSPTTALVAGPAVPDAAAATVSTPAAAQAPADTPEPVTATAPEVVSAPVDGDDAYQPGADDPAPAAPVVVLSNDPVSVALRAAGITDPAVESFYAARAHAPFWLGSDPAWAAALIASLDTVEAHGLPQARYDVTRLKSLRGAPATATAEAAFMRAYLTFARDISSGLLEPNDVDGEIHIKPLRPVAADLMARLTRPAAPQDFNDLAPQSAEYARLLKALADHRAQAQASVTTARVPDGRTLRPGDRSARVPALRARLIALGDFGAGRDPGEAASDAEIVPVAATPVAPADPELFDADLVAAVQHFQARSGLKDDGAVGPQTLAAINATETDRYGQLLVNIERVRWLHRDVNERHIFVNQAEFMMELVENDRVLLESRVVVGKAPKHRTPEFVDMMDHMVVNPSWHVPFSIATQEILPILKNDPGYLSRKGMRITPTGGGGVPSDFSGYSRSYFPFRIRQNPSEGNALGRVKFMFPNQFAIYLHDTPQKSLFNRETRAFSHGCVRVHKPFELAHALLEGQEDDPKAAFDRLLNRKAERRVDLDRPVRVYLTYRTAWVDRAGNLQYRADIYGRDARVLAALKDSGVALIN